MPDVREMPNYVRLSIPQRLFWNGPCRRDYHHYFSIYSCENADHAEMKETAQEYCEERLSTMRADTSPHVADKRRFYRYALENYAENLDLLMDIFLLDNMWQWWDHDEGDRVEFYIMYKHGPY